MLTGFILGALVMKFILRHTQELHGPNSTKMMQETYFCEKTNKTYKFIPDVCACPI